MASTWGGTHAYPRGQVSDCRECADLPMGVADQIVCCTRRITSKGTQPARLVRRPTGALSDPITFRII